MNCLHCHVLTQWYAVLHILALWLYIIYGFVCFEAKNQMSGVEWMDTPYTDAMTIDPAKKWCDIHLQNKYNNTFSFSKVHGNSYTAKFYEFLQSLPMALF